MVQNPIAKPVHLGVHPRNARQSTLLAKADHPGQIVNGLSLGHDQVHQRSARVSLAGILAGFATGTDLPVVNARSWEFGATTLHRDALQRDVQLELTTASWNEKKKRLVRMDRFDQLHEDLFSKTLFFMKWRFNIQYTFTSVLPIFKKCLICKQVW